MGQKQKRAILEKLPFQEVECWLYLIMNFRRSERHLDKATSKQTQQICPK
jgi:hypothetical protein